MDGQWLWVAGELLVSYAFYRTWSSDDKFLSVLKITPNIDINDLKGLSEKKSIDYAVVHGLVRPLDNKSSSILDSQYAAHHRGVIQRITIQERRLEKFFLFLSETSKTISRVTRHVPFRLASSTGFSIRVDRPLNFDSIEDHLDMIYSKYEPRNLSALDKFVDIFTGDLSTGFETQEEMLLIDVPLTAVGRLEKQSDNVWHLLPHEKWGGILTRASREEIITEYRDRLQICRFLSIFFGLAAGCTAAYLLYRFYRDRKRRLARFPQVPPTDQTVETNPNLVRLRCIICLENEVIYSLQPCSHLGLCHFCAERLQSRNQGAELCPICRAPIERYQRVFLR